MSKQQILLVEDDVNFGSVLRSFLEMNDLDVTLVDDGLNAVSTFKAGQFDLCILDVMLPHVDGFTIGAEIKQLKPAIPIIYLTAKNMKEDVLAGFKIGADDYITKPFNMEELLLRIEAVLRRSGISDSEAFTSFKLGGYVFESIKQTLQYNDEDPVKLTTKESELLKLLCMNVNKVLERNYALKQVWDDDNYFNARSMDVYITKLRKLLKSDDSIEILNIHGKGYKLIVSDAD